MKLHFYFIEEMQDGTQTIRHEEAEAEERARSYALKTVPQRCHTTTIRKSIVGDIVTQFGRKVILTEDNADEAKRIFIEHYSSLIQMEKTEIDRYLETIKMIKEWEE